MFNFFDEIKKKVTGIEPGLLSSYNLVSISGRLLYVEGHQGLTVINSKEIAFKVKKGRIVVEGEGLFLSELTDNTMLIKGKIEKIETF